MNLSFHTELIFTYLIKVNLALILFYALYRLCCAHDTFFRWKRTVLLAFLVVAWMYPWTNFQNWMSDSAPLEEAFTRIKAPFVNSSEALVSAENVTKQEAFVQPVSQDRNFLTVNSVLLLVYITGVVLLLSRFLFQLFVLFRISRQAIVRTYKGRKIRLLQKESGPFSFFRGVFIHPNSLRLPDKAEEILAHESVHARQMHSVDILLCELNHVFCWFNPVSGLLKREIRENLEYIADHEVLNAGYDTKSYQYHLLELTHSVKSYSLYNPFNLLPLKKRIMMMNKKRSKKTKKLNYFLFLPVVALLLVGHTVETVALPPQTAGTNSVTKSPQSTEKKKLANETNLHVGPKISTRTPLILFNGEVISKKINFDVKTADNETFASFLGVDLNEIGQISIYKGEQAVHKFGERGKEGVLVFETKAYLQAQDNYNDAYRIIINDFQEPTSSTTTVVSSTQSYAENEPDKIYTHPEEFAVFKSHRNDLLEYLNENLTTLRLRNRPTQKESDSSDSENTVRKTMIYIQFVVEKEGTISGLEINDIHKVLSEETKKELTAVIQQMPAWKPAKIGGNIVRCREYYGYQILP